MNMKTSTNVGKMVSNFKNISNNQTNNQNTHAAYHMYHENQI